MDIMRYQRLASGLGLPFERLIDLNPVNGIDGSTVSAGLDRNPKAKEFLTEAGKVYDSNTARYGGVLRAIGDRIRTDNKVIDQLDDALSNPKDPNLGKDLIQAAKTNPSYVAGVIRGWKGEPAELRAAVNIEKQRMAGLSKDQAASPPTEAAASTPLPRQGKGGSPSPKGTGLENVAATVDEAVRAEKASKAGAVAPTPQAAASVAVAEPPVEAGAVSEKLSGSDIQALFDSNSGIMRGALKAEFPELGDKIDRFSDYITKHPNAAGNMAWLLNENPEMMKMLSGADDGKPMDPKLKQQMKDLMKGKLGEMLDKPEEFENRKSVESMSQSIKSGMALKGAMDWVKNTIGIDLGKMGGELMESLGPMLKGLMSFIGGFFKGFQGDGNFLGQSAGPQQGGNMFPNFMKRMGVAMDDAPFQAGLDARDRGFSTLDVGTKGRGLGSDGTVLYETGPRRGEPIRFSQKEGGFEVVQNRQGQWVEAVNGEPKQNGRTLEKDAAKAVSTRYDAAWDDRVTLTEGGKEVGKFFVAGDRAATSMGTPVYRQVSADGKVGDAYYLNKEGNSYQFRTADGKPFGDAAERELRERVFGRSPSSGPGMDVTNSPPTGLPGVG